MQTLIQAHRNYCSTIKAFSFEIGHSQHKLWTTKVKVLNIQNRLRVAIGLTCVGRSHSLASC